MFGIFSGSSSSRRRPNPYQGGSYYQRGGLFGLLGSRSHSGAYYPPQYPHQPPYVQQPTQGQYVQQPPVQPQPQAVQPTSPAVSGACPQCGAAVPAGSKFCLSCGAKLGGPAVCPNCGKPLPSGAKFCPECGSPAR